MLKLKSQYPGSVVPLAMFYQTTLRFISVSNSLPKTSYVKMIDIWLLFNLIIPFAEVMSLKLFYD